MITLLGALLGFLGALVPECMKIWRDTADKRHELAILERQMEMQRSGIQERMEAIGLWAEVEERRVLQEGYFTQIPWVDALNGTVRPVLAYAFFLLYAYVKWQQAQHTPWQIWLEDDRAIFAGIISFYFGQRALRKWPTGRG